MVGIRLAYIVYLRLSPSNNILSYMYHVCTFSFYRLHHQQIITSDVLVDVIGSLHRNTVTAIDSVRVSKAQCIRVLH